LQLDASFGGSAPDIFLSFLSSSSLLGLCWQQQSTVALGISPVPDIAGKFQLYNDNHFLLLTSRAEKLAVWLE